MEETIKWITDKTILPEDDQLVLIAAWLQIGPGNFINNEWYWEDGGPIGPQPVDAWALMPRGPYTKIDLDRRRP